MSQVKFTKEQEQYIAEMMAQEVAKQNKALELKQSQREQNKVVLGARVQELRIQNGSPIVDKETKQQKIVNGEPQCYPNKYYVKLQSMGVELEAEISEITHNELEQFKTYQCEGYIGIVKFFGVEQIAPIFNKFTLI